MKKTERIVTNRYVEVDYHQFHPPRGLGAVRTLLGILSWPLVLPIALLCRTSDFVFRTFSELFALIPFLFGTILRYELYRFTLSSCGRNVVIGFGTVFLYRDVEIGDHVLLGMYNTVHFCDFGSYVLTADGCRFLSGSRYHRFERADLPMALQGGELRRIRVADDCWIGANAVVMDDVGRGGVVGAGSVVTSPVAPFAVVAGIPAREIRKRGTAGFGTIGGTEGGS